jgi:hypothetical protein
MEMRGDKDSEEAGVRRAQKYRSVSPMRGTAGAQPYGLAYTDLEQLSSVNLNKNNVLDTIHHLFV